MRLSIIGSNIEALTTAVVMASLGHDVSWRVDKTELNDLLAHYAFEHQLIALWQLYRHQGGIGIVNAPSQKEDRVYWLFVDGMTDAELDAAPSYAQVTSQIVLSGSAQVGDMEALAQRFDSKAVFFIPFVFLRDGASFSSMLTPSLLLIGEKTTGSVAQLELISPLVKNAQQFATSSIKNTEFSRTSIMAMLASRLSFMNEMSRLADALTVDINVVKNMMGLDGRIGGTYLSPSWGFGGQTLPHALELLQDDFAAASIRTELISAVSSINQDQKELIFRKFWRYFDSFIAGKSVLIWGAGYKAGSGRTLNSAIHPLLSLLWQHDVATWVYDPQAASELESLYGDACQLITNPYEKLTTVDALFILNWPDVSKPDVERLAQHSIPVFDAQNLLSNEEVAQLQGYYAGIGRGQA